MDADLSCSDTLGVSWSAVDTIILLDFAPLRCACPGALRRAPLLWAMADSISRAQPACLMQAMGKFIPHTELHVIFQGGTPVRCGIRANRWQVKLGPCKLHVLISIHKGKDDTHSEWKPLPRRITYHGRRDKLIFPAASLKLASTRCEHVLHPLASAAVGKGDNKGVGCSKNVHWGAIDLTRFTTHVSRMPNPGNQPVNRLVIRFVTAILIFASHLLRNRMSRTPMAARRTMIMTAVFTASTKVNGLVSLASEVAHIGLTNGHT